MGVSERNAASGARCIRTAAVGPTSRCRIPAAIGVASFAQDSGCFVAVALPVTTLVAISLCGSRRRRRRDMLRLKLGSCAVWFSLAIRRATNSGAVGDESSRPSNDAPVVTRYGIRPPKAAVVDKTIPAVVEKIIPAAITEVVVDDTVPLVQEATPCVMDGIPSPLAIVPSMPTYVDQSCLLGVPDFSLYAEQLVERQRKQLAVQEVTASGKQLVFLMMCRLQQSDLVGAEAALESIRALPSPRAVLGPELWEDPELRLVLCQNADVGRFIEKYVLALSFLSVMQRGIFLPSVPTEWQVGVKDYDDEAYLLGAIGGLRELERYAVNRGCQLDLESVSLCLAIAQSFEQALMRFDFRNSDLRQRFDGVKYGVKKLEVLVYEINLARARAGIVKLDPAVGIGAEVVDENVLKTNVAPALDLELLAGIKVTYDAYDAKREEVLKRSRNVAKSAKNAIYALQREDFKAADRHLTQCREEAIGIYNDIIVKYPRLRRSFFSQTLEEYVEAYALLVFLKERRIITYEELKSANCLPFGATIDEYIGGLMDLTGEIGRIAIRKAGLGRKSIPGVEFCLVCVNVVRNGVEELVPFTPALGKKMGALSSTLSKIEKALYELALLSDDFERGFNPTAPDEEEKNDSAAPGRRRK